MKVIRFFCCVAFLFIMQQWGVGQRSLGGKVVDGNTGEGIILGNVTLYQEGLLIVGTDTDFDGNFSFSGLVPGIYDVEASYVGYHANRVNGISLLEGNVLDVVIELNEGVTMDAIEIVEYKVPLVSFDETQQGRTFNSKRRSKRNRHNKNDPSGGDNYFEPAENKFISPIVESHSTFSLDVDRASYSNVRRFINDGTLPPPEAVRIEELINYFEYDYEDQSTKHPISINSNYISCPWNASHDLLHLSVKAKEIETEDIPASNLVFLLDVSGSMSGRLSLVKESFSLLVDNLRPIDRVAIVTYAGSDRIALPSTPASEKNAILMSLDKLESGGSTAGARGIVTAYELAENNFIKDGNNRVILATDGDFNVGIRSAEELEQLITAQKESGVFLSVLGFGRGNYHDHEMQTLANKGNGNHAYIDNIKEAEKVLVSEFGGTLFTVAKDVKIQVEFNPAYVQAYRLVGYENRMLDKNDFKDDTKDAGEVGAGHTVTAIYEIIPRGSVSEFSVVVDGKRWQKAEPLSKLQRAGIWVMSSADIKNLMAEEV